MAEAGWWNSHLASNKKPKAWNIHFFYEHLTKCFALLKKRDQEQLSDDDDFHERDLSRSLVLRYENPWKS